MGMTQKERKVEIRRHIMYILSWVDMIVGTINIVIAVLIGNSTNDMTKIRIFVIVGILSLVTGGMGVNFYDNRTEVAQRNDTLNN